MTEPVKMNAKVTYISTDASFMINMEEGHEATAKVFADINEMQRLANDTDYTITKLVDIHLDGIGEWELDDFRIGHINLQVSRNGIYADLVHKYSPDVTIELELTL